METREARRLSAMMSGLMMAGFTAVVKALLKNYPDEADEILKEMTKNCQHCMSELEDMQEEFCECPSAETTDLMKKGDGFFYHILCGKRI